MSYRLNKWIRQRKKNRAMELAAIELLSDSGVDPSSEQVVDALFRHPLFTPSQKKFELVRLLNLVKERKPKNLLEIGDYTGGSLFAFCQAAPENSRIVSVDINYPEDRVKAYRRFKKKGQFLATLKLDTQSREAEKVISQAFQGEMIDLLFIDGDHSLFGVMNDYFRFRPMVKKGGYIVFHDINPDLQMKTGVKSSSYVGDVPIFWKMLLEKGFQVEECIENQDQDGFGLGILVNQ